MLGLRKLWAAFQGNNEVHKIETEIGRFFAGSGDFLIHRVGPSVAHAAIQIVEGLIITAASQKLSGAEKHAQVASQLNQALVAAGHAALDPDLINSVIEAGLDNVRLNKAES